MSKNYPNVTLARVFMTLKWAAVLGLVVIGLTMVVFAQGIPSNSRIIDHLPIPILVMTIALSSILGFISIGSYIWQYRLYPSSTDTGLLRDQN